MQTLISRYRFVWQHDRANCIATVVCAVTMAMAGFGMCVAVGVAG
jgi:hypothetical protein